MHQKRVTQINGAGRTCRKRLLARFGVGKIACHHVAHGCAIGAVGEKKTRHIAMRTDADAGGGIVFSDIGKQEQHQECAALRGNVGPKREEVRGVVGGQRKAGINVPTVIARRLLDMGAEA